MNTENKPDDRPEVLVDWDEYSSVREISALLCRVPELSQLDGTIMEDLPGGDTRCIPSAKLRHYISSVCILVNERGIRIHPNSRLVNGVLHSGSYPGLRFKKY